jgi:opacity protein-like surface antigen
MKKIFFIFLLFVIPFIKALSQDVNNHSRYELMGSISYNYSNTKYQQSFSAGFNEQHAVTLQPSIGYFLSDNIELLVDLRYIFTYINDTSWPIEQWNHTIGFNVGAAYNIIINPFFTTFIGSKIGLNWSRNIYLWNDGYKDDSHWSNRQLLFPMFTLGGRFTITKECSFLAIVEYSNNSSDNSLQPQIKNTEKVSLGLGLSVFL